MLPDFLKGLCSYKSGDRIVGTYYFYWYNVYTKEHIINPDGSDALTDHPRSLEDYSYSSIRWHKRELEDILAAGLDYILPVYWGSPADRKEGTGLHWSFAGLPHLVEACRQLEQERKRPPGIGLFYDTSTLQYNSWSRHIDLTGEYGKA